MCPPPNKRFSPKKMPEISGKLCIGPYIAAVVLAPLLVFVHVLDFGGPWLENVLLTVLALALLYIVIFVYERQVKLPVLRTFISAPPQLIYMAGKIPAAR
jgi:hypothetical protein